MPFKTGINKGKLTRQELVDEYGHHFKKIRGFWSRGDIVNKLQDMGVEVKYENQAEHEDVLEEVVEPVVEEPEPELELVLEEPKPQPKKRGRKKKTEN